MPALSITRLGRIALDLIYPPKCAICGTGGVFLCDRCVDALPAAAGYRCDRCWRPLRGSRCYACLQDPPLLLHLRSAYRYEGSARQLVHAFKFGGHSSLAPDIARLLAGTLEQHALEADVIAPVPLTNSRRRIRGYNQALLMATEL
jgi:predicted amidophosphoribosyltransferase